MAGPHSTVGSTSVSRARCGVPGQATYFRLHLILIDCLGGLNLLGNSVVRLSDRPNMTIAISVLL